MKVSTAGQSRFLAREDIPVPVIVTMDNVVEDHSLRNPFVLQFIDDVLKPLPLNVSNRRIIVAAYGDDSDNWHGRLIEIVFNPLVPNPRDPSRPGGIQVRIPAPGAAPKPAASPRVDDAPPPSLTQDEKHQIVLDGYAGAQSLGKRDEFRAWARRQGFSKAHDDAQRKAFNDCTTRLSRKVGG